MQRWRLVLGFACASRVALAALVLLPVLPDVAAHAATAFGPELPADVAPGGARTWVRGPLQPHAPPDVLGPGTCVSTVGNVWIKTTNAGFMGNPLPQGSSDPSGTWPGSSGVQYGGTWSLWVGAKNAEAVDPSQLRRVSNGAEYRPPTLDPVDRIYTAFEGQSRGLRDVDDDADGRRDEEFLNGRDDDGDSAVDEDYAAISQQMCSLEMRDDTEQAINGNFQERHVPLGLLVRQRSLAFAIPGTNDFVGVEYSIYNISGHTLDSVFVGWFADLDAGVTADDRFFADDLTDPRVPQGSYVEPVTPTDPRYDAMLCTQDTITVNGWTLLDDNGDMGRTIGAGSFLLLGHTTDPTGLKAPRRVGFRMYKTYAPGTPYSQGGQPLVDIERYEAMSSLVGIDPVTGLINEPRTDESTRTDFRSLCAVGPFLSFENGERIDVQVALAVQRCDYAKPIDDPGDAALPNVERYAAIIDNAIEVQKTFSGGYVPPAVGEETPDARGREAGLIAAPGTIEERSDCRDPEGSTRTVTDDEITWFDLDCNFCTGVPGRALRRWLAASPPPNPTLRLTAADRRIILEWDNKSETIPDPSSGLFDFKAYRIWKASNYTRPVGSAGPGEELWALLAEFRRFDDLYPLRDSSDTDGDGRFDAIEEIAPLLLNVQSGQRIYPGNVAPLTDPATGDTLFAIGDRPYHDAEGVPRTYVGYRVPMYPVGRYRFEDPNVLNGFPYFYSVTGLDSTGQEDSNGNRGTIAQQEGRRAAVEQQVIVPQARTAGGGSNSVYVVPNPYRGRAQWDLTPSAADPTGTHIDFMNLPAGEWTLRIFTVSGDLVQTIHNDDLTTSGHPQQETPEDGQAEWNLISRNGQDIASGIYLFSVNSANGTQQGKFVVIR
ncbi:MAG: hypothetical protein ACREOU_11690 [Candidatus Eiseniibacteriota bacterium]